MWSILIDALVERALTDAGTLVLTLRKHTLQDHLGLEATDVERAQLEIIHRWLVKASLPSGTCGL
jgi:hypothetical protein